MASRQSLVLLLLGMVILITTTQRLADGQQEEDPPTEKEPQPVKDPPVPSDPIEKPPEIGQTPYPKSLHEKLLSLFYNSLFHKLCNQPSSVYKTQDEMSSPVKQLQVDKSTSHTIKKLYHWTMFHVFTQNSMVSSCIKQNWPQSSFIFPLFWCKVVWFLCVCFVQFVCSVSIYCLFNKWLGCKYYKFRDIDIIFVSNEQINICRLFIISKYKNYSNPTQKQTEAFQAWTD